MKYTTFAIVLVLSCFTAVAVAQTQSDASESRRRYEERAGQLEEIAMCHHAIKAAHHDALALDQNPYYRYIVYSPHKGQGANVYPIPERCKSLETDWILQYTNLRAEVKAIEDQDIHDAVGLTISDLATDAQFLTVVINKMNLEGEKSIYLENRDKDIP
jgi:hypothetical protein